MAAGAAAPLHQLNAEPLLHGDQPVLVGPAQQGELQSSSDTYPYYTCTVLYIVYRNTGSGSKILLTRIRILLGHKIPVLTRKQSLTALPILC